MDQRIENLIIFVIKIGIFFCLFTPLIIYNGVSYPTIFPKTIFFRTIVEIIFIFYILLILFKKQYLPKLSPLFLSILVFMGILTISSIFGINPYRSFWGTGERSEGLITFFHLLLFFTILISVFKEKNDWFRFLKFTVFISFLVGLSAIIQKLRIFSFYSTDPSRPSGVLGNPDFVPGFLIFGIFLALYFILQEKKWTGKILYGIIFFVNTIVLILTQTRSGWVGISFGFAFLLVFFFLFYQKKFFKPRRTILFGILITLLFALVVSLNQDKPIISENQYFNRFFSILDYQRALKDRFIPWQISLQAFKERPLLGWGLESYNFVYDKYFKTDYLPTFPGGGGFDRVHNKIFDLLIEGGILLLLGYLLIFFLIFYYLFKYPKGQAYGDNFNPSASFIFAALFIAYFIQNLFVFDTLSTHISFFLVLGFLNNFGSRFPEILKVKKEVDNLSFGCKKLVLIFGFIIFIIFTIYQTNLKPFFSNFYFVKGFNLLGKDCQAASENFQKSFKYNTFLNQEFSLLGAQGSFSALERTRDKRCKEIIFNDLLLFRGALKEAIESPDIKHAVSLRLLGRLNTNLYLLSGNLQYLEEGEKILWEAANYKSQLPLVYQSLGEIRMWEGKEKEGIDFYKRALLLNLNMSTLIEFHKKLGMAYRETREEKKERKELNRALKLSYLNNNPDFYIITRLGDFYIKENDSESLNQLYQEAIKQYNKAIETTEGFNPELYTSLATLYAKTGEKEKARETVKMISQIEPYLKPAVLKMLQVIEQQ